MKNKRLVLASRPSGLIKNSDFNLEEVDMPKVKDGEILIQTNYLSLAPVMKYYMLDGAGFENPLAIGDTMRGRGVGKIIESKNSQYPVGKFVTGKFGWQEYVISDCTADKMMYLLDDHGLSPSTALGILGVTGYTSYFGLYDVGELKEGDTVLVSAAAGGVGNILGGLARLKGARTIGLTSKDEKKRILLDKLNYDAVINYREENVSERLSELAPDGIDVYFDNVGGEILDIALTHLKMFARIVGCGRISTYGDHGLYEQQYALKNWHLILAKRAKMQGFFIYNYESRFPEAHKDLLNWLKRGELAYHEDILEGLEKMPEALNRLFEGKNVGKQLVKIN